MVLVPEHQTSASAGGDGFDDPVATMLVDVRTPFIDDRDTAPWFAQGETRATRATRQASLNALTALIVA
jgi:hypothetical protein